MVSYTVRTRLEYYISENLQTDKAQARPSALARGFSQDCFFLSCKSACTSSEEPSRSDLQVPIAQRTWTKILPGLLSGLVGSLTTWRLALMRKPQPHSTCCGRPTAAGAPRSRAVIVAPQRQATSTCKVTATQVRKQAEEDTFINQAGR